MGAYNFRHQGGGVPSAIALRKIQLEERAQSQREELAFGSQELAAMRMAVDIEKQKEELRFNIEKEKQTVAATQAVVKLDPKSPSWREDYARIMAEHPHAQEDRFLQGNFQQVGKVNQAYVEHDLNMARDERRYQNDAESDQRTAGRQKTQDVFRSAEDTRRFMEAQAARGIDVSPYYGESPDGQAVVKDWSGMASAIKSATESVPSASVFARYSEVQGHVAQHVTQAQAQAAADTKANIPNNPYKEQGKLDSAKTESQMLENRFPALAAMKPTNAQPQPSASTPSVQDIQAGDEAQTALMNGAQPAATPAPAASPAAQPSPTPFPSPPPGAIQYLQTNPATKDLFEKNFGPGSAEQYFGKL